MVPYQRQFILVAMKVSDYSYDLPEQLIADQPPASRGTSRLLVVHRGIPVTEAGSLEDVGYGDITRFLTAGDLLVLNDTRVIKARLQTTKTNGAIPVPRELMILEKHGTDTDWLEHKVLYRRRLAVGDKLAVGTALITVTKILGDGLALVHSSQDLLELSALHGSVPLPPYMHREATATDTERYQSVWANQAGSVAAPTASLNMTEEILAALRAKGVQIAYLTLHVGLGTFLPIRSDDVEGHHMHQEYFEIPAATIEAVRLAKAAEHRVIALGTTVARTLEYASDSLHQLNAAVPPATDISGEADIFMYPGYRFQTIDGLLTNFHAPKSTVLMLTAAFTGWDRLLAAYQHAVAEQYHFLSYGDSMLIL